MTSEMKFECLLVSSDPAVYGPISNVLYRFSMSLDHCLSSSRARDVIASGNHELVVIDWEGNSSSELLRAIWNLPKKRKPTVVAVSGQNSSVPGVHVTLRKPVTLESGTASLRTAYSHLLVDYRRKRRYAIMTSVMAINQKHCGILVRITDIGEGGVGLYSKEKVTVGDVLSFSLLLPDTTKAIELKAQVAWTREYGTAGCEFLDIPPVDSDILRNWLKAKTRARSL